MKQNSAEPEVTLRLCDMTARHHVFVTPRGEIPVMGAWSGAGVWSLTQATVRTRGLRQSALPSLAFKFMFKAYSYKPSLLSIFGSNPKSPDIMVMGGPGESMESAWAGSDELSLSPL